MISTIIRRNSILLVATILVVIQQQKQYSMYSTVFAFHASLPNRAPGTIVRNNDRTSSTTGHNGIVDVVIILRAASLSAQEAAERMKQQQQQLDREAMEQEQPPSLFEPQLVNEMNAAYNTLEKRFLDGPGSLTISEIEELEIRFQKIITEMKLNEHKRPKKPTTISRDVTGGATFVDAVATTTTTASIPASVPNVVPVQQQQQPTSPIVTEESSYKIPNVRRTSIDISNDDDGIPQYDGTGGMGQPRGTVNTYAIDGMDEMSTDEYLEALKNRVINVQRERRLTGQAGSRGSWSYLNSLSGDDNNNGILNKKKNE